MDNNNCDYLEMMEEMENSWQTAVEKAMCVREDQLTIAQRAIQDLRRQTHHQDSQLRMVSREVVTLRTTVSDLNAQLEAAKQEIADMKENTDKILDEKDEAHEEEIESISDDLKSTRRELEAKEKELYELRRELNKSVQDAENRALESLRGLQNQLKMAKEQEEIDHRRILELESTTRDQAKRLEDWNRVSVKMCDELKAMKGKLLSCRYANGKLKEDLHLWKKYCESAEEERKSIFRDFHLQKRVLQKFTQVEAYLKSERDHRNLSVDALNNLGKCILKEFRNQSKATRLVSVESQTDFETYPESGNSDKNDPELETLKLKAIEMEEEIKKAYFDVNNLTQQNTTLRDVIKSMRKEREQIEKERENIEEDARLERLEGSMKLLKRSLLSEQKDVCVWSALHDVKKEVANLKIKNLTNNQDNFDKSNHLSYNNQQGFIIKPLGRK